MRLQWRVHRLIWALSGGRLGRRVMGMPVLELVTIGHRSGEPRSILISYVETDDGPALAGTNAGAGYDPAWVRNLRSEPSARMRRDGNWSDVRARFLTADDWSEVWEEFTTTRAGYADYRDMTDRPIPLVVLESAS